MEDVTLAACQLINLSSPDSPHSTPNAFRLSYRPVPSLHFVDYFISYLLSHLQSIHQSAKEADAI